MREKLMQAVILTFLLKVVMGLNSPSKPQISSPWQSNLTPTISETIIVEK